jgi:hypothetical protein
VTGLPVFMAASALVAVSATAGVSLLGLRSALDKTLAWVLVVSAVIVMTLFVAGVLIGDLVVWVVLVLNLAVAALLTLASLALGHRPRLPSWRPPSLHAAVLMARRDLWLSALLVVATGEVLWRIAIAYLMPPYANDALWYHLTTVAGWLQADKIGPSRFTIWSTVYPFNGELLFTWPALLLGNDTFVDAVQLPFAVVGALAVAGIGRTVGLSRRGSAAAGCLFLLAPIVLSQTTASYTDLIFTAFFLVAFHFVLRFVTDLSRMGRGSGAHAFLGGMAGGLALGTKSLGIVYIGILLILFCGHLVAARLLRHANTTGLACSLALFVLPLLAFGSYRYIETWSRFGNPFYPVQIAVLGIELFPGRPLWWFLNPPLESGSWWREVWGQWRRDYFFLVQPRFHAYSYDDRSSGLGPLWSYIALPLLAVFVVRLVQLNRAMLLNLLIPVAAMFALQPYRWWSRFTMLLIAVGMIAIVTVVEAIGPRWSTRLKVLVFCVVGLGIGFPTLKIDGRFWATEIAGVARLPASERTIGRVVWPGYRWIDRTPPRATIGVDTSADFLGGQPYIVPYPLFGSHFEHHVDPLPRASQAMLERVIAQKRIAYVFVHRGGKLDVWTQSAVRAGCARRIYDGLVFNGQFGRAYRLVPGCDWSRTARKT